MTMYVIFLVILAAGLLTESQGGDCGISDNELRELTTTYGKKCLSKGFESSLAGCKSQENPDELTPGNIKKCKKIQKQLDSCDVDCQVDGGWSDFGAWSSCSGECGGGEMTRERECSNPTPENGGAGCEGKDTETQQCNTQPCTTQYTIIHTTGTNKRYAGATSGAYLFTLIGSDGQTDEHDCSADRSNDARGECSFEDANKIGKLKGMRIKNKSDNTWVFVIMVVKIDGVVRGRWLEKRKVNDYETLTISFTYIGDERVAYEIHHATGTEKYYGGATSGAYLFTLIGTEGKTSPHECPVDRTEGAVGQCTFKDYAAIGSLTGVRIKNRTDNTWVFVSMSVKVNGVPKGVWMGTGDDGMVNDRKTLTITLKTD